MARGECSGEMNSRFIRTHIDLPLLYQHHLHSHSVMLYICPIENQEVFDWKTFIPKVICDPECIFCFCSSILATFWFKTKKIRDKTIQTFKKGEKVNLNRIWKEKQQMYCQNARRKKKKTCLTGEVFICISVVHANIKHLMSAFFRDTDERKRDARLTLSSHNQTVTRFSKQLAAQLSWHQTLTLQ